MKVFPYARIDSRLPVEIVDTPLVFVTLNIWSAKLSTPFRERPKLSAGTLARPEFL